jgi:fructose-1-phosphate kinase PfkB-like protein
MSNEMTPLKKFIDLKLILAVGSTRTNVTVLDSAEKKEMHLRSVSELATKASLKRLNAELKKIVTRNSMCVFAGSMPDKSLTKETEQLIRTCACTGAQVFVDTSGPPLRRLTHSGYVSMITPNVEELRGLLRCNIADTPTALSKAGRVLLRCVDSVLISRGKKGVVLITTEGIWTGGAILRSKKIISTVGCGDYLLAGLLYGLKENKGYGRALELALKAATARAVGMTESQPWPKIRRDVEVIVRR